VYAQPASAWVARFFGLGNLVEGRVESGKPLSIATALGCFEPGCFTGDLHPGERVTLLLRPGGAQIAAGEDGSPNQVHGVVEDAFFHGDSFRVRLRTAASEPLAFALGSAPLAGVSICLRLSSENIVCLKDETGRNANG
jgi:ABC-type Fe3+/spermidine/putrescine transport system ATPase subunit